MTRHVTCTICLTDTPVTGDGKLGEHLSRFTGEPCRAVGSIGVAQEHSVEDPETGVQTVTFRLW